MKKRFFSAALAGCMMLTMIPVSAFAAGEGATEVSIEQYAAAADAKLTKIGPEDRALLVKKTGKERGDFWNNAGQLKPMVEYNGVTGSVSANNCGTVSQQNGYFLPLKLYVPGANAKTLVTVEETALSVSSNAASALKETTYGYDIFIDGDDQDKPDTACLIVQVARLDGEYLRDAVKVKVDLNGDEKDVATFTIPMSETPLADSEFKNLKENMEVCTDGAKKFGTVSGNGHVQKRAVDLYDVEKKIVKKVTGFTAYDRMTDDVTPYDEDVSKGYYLPFFFKLDGNVAKIDGYGVTPTGAVVPLDQVPTTPTDKGEVSFVLRIAGLDGKKLYDKIIVDVYPEGLKSGYPNGDGALTKRLTFDVSSAVLDRDVVSKTVRVPKVNDVKDDITDYTYGNFLAFRNNIGAVKSIALNAKGDLLTVTADLDALSTSTSYTYLPVLFSLTKDGAAITAKQSDVVKFGGTIGKDYVAYINLRDSRKHPEVEIEDNSGNVYKVEYKIVSASKVPVLTDSTVKSENGKLTGLTATATAKTVADVKAMYTLNGGKVTVLNAAGKTLKDTDAVGTGCVIVLKDAEDDEIERVTVVVKGDVLGEGRMHLGQLVAAAKAVKGTEPLEDEYLLAGDINGNGKMELGDLVGIAALMK